MFVIVPTFKTFPQSQFREVLRLLVALFVTVHSAEDGQMAGSPHRHRLKSLFWVLVTTPVTPLISALFTSVSFTNQKQNDLQKNSNHQDKILLHKFSKNTHILFCKKTQDTHTYELKIPKTSSSLLFDSVSQLQD